MWSAGTWARPSLEQWTVSGGRTFLDEVDRRRFLGLVSELPERFVLEVHAFVLRENRYHLLLRCRETNLSHAIRWLQVQSKAAVAPNLRASVRKARDAKCSGYLPSLECFSYVPAQTEFGEPWLVGRRQIPFSFGWLPEGAKESSRVPPPALFSRHERRMVEA